MDISSTPPSSPDDSSTWIIEGSDQTFMEDVIEASQDKVVLVDFWAPWCGPCKTLIPTLEKVTNQAGGDVKLVKINIDENQGIAQQLSVRSVPTVFAFHKGRPVDGFQGALPESQIIDFIKKVGGGGNMEQIEQALQAAAEAFESGDIDQAGGIYSQIVQADPENIDALTGLARCFLSQNEFDKVRDVLGMIPEDARSQPQVISVLTALELAGDGASQDDDETSGLAAKVQAEPNNLEARFEYAEALTGQSNFDEASDQLVEIMTQDLEWNEGAAKAQLLKIFEAAGPKADVTIKGRRKLSSLLFR